MSATVDTNTDWQQEAVALRRDHAMATIEIAERFGKSASQVRRVLSAANTERAVNGPSPGDEVPGDEAWSGSYGGDEQQGDIERAVEKPEDPLHAFKAEAGESVGDMPPVTPPEAESYEVVVKGTRQLALDFGENAAMITGATVKLVSEKRPSGFYGLGDVITGTFTARVTKAPGEEKFDKDLEDFVAKPTAYVATITEWEID